MEHNSSDDISDVTISHGVEPFARATIRDGEILLAEWDRHLQVVPSEHGAYRDAAARGVFIVDLARDLDAHDVREMFVVELAGVQVPDEVIRAISRYADATGYQRLWWPRGTMDLTGLVPFGALAQSACGSCGSVRSEDSVRWWHFVSRSGRFPTKCCICASHSLGNWAIVESEPSPKLEELDDPEYGRTKDFQLGKATKIEAGEQRVLFCESHDDAYIDGTEV